MSRRSLVALLSALALLVAACGSDSTDGTEPSDDADTTTADDPCDGYPSQDITFIVPYSPGGGFDTWARLTAPYLEEYLPNDVSVLVENREGAGGIVGATAVYSSAPDGYTIGITEPGILATTQIGGQTEIDLASISAIGRIVVSPEVIFVAADNEWETIEDVQAAGEDGPVLMATGGLAAVNIVSFDALGIPFENIVHEGSSESVLSLIRGDTEIAVFTLNSQLEGLQNGDIKPLVLVGTAPDEGEVGHDVVGDIPTLDEATGVEGLGSALEQHRIVFAPPGTPDCVVQILSDALGQTLSDPDLLADAEEAGQLPPVPADAAATQEVVVNVLNQLTEYSDLLEQTVEE